jgi:hypothetical protein
MRKLLLAILIAQPVASVPKTLPAQCSVPVAVPQTASAPGSTYYNDGEPPKRFARVPKGAVSVRFGQASIDAVCGVPPCGYVFEGCTDGKVMALPDPFKVSDAQFARIARHELGHISGWPATHGS